MATILKLYCSDILIFCSFSIQTLISYEPTSALEGMVIITFTSAVCEGNKVRKEP